MNLKACITGNGIAMYSETCSALALESPLPQSYHLVSTTQPNQLLKSHGFKENMGRFGGS